MITIKRHVIILFVIGFLAALFSVQIEAKELSVQPRPVVVHPVKNDVSRELRNIKPIPPSPGAEVREIPLHPLDKPKGPKAPLIEDRIMDPVVQDWPVEVTMPSTIRNFEGVSNVNGVLPPDTNGDVGPNHYIQMVNLSFAIWDKSGNLLYGPANNNTLWSGFGGLCETGNYGDPIVLYDHLADRWIMSQFALNFYTDFHQCIAVSQTGDPTGAWYRYDFLISNSKMNDYPKIGVWPDGYYMAVNQFTNIGWGGQGVVAFERDKMLLGLPAQMVYFDLYALDSNLGGMLPSDLDGAALPPVNSPNYFVQFDDNAWGYSPDQLQIWEFHVDWATPANSTFTGPALLATAPFDSNMCGYNRNCIPQPGTARRVDALSDRLMYRLQYRNFGTHESLVTNHTVDVGADHAGIRWYEIQDPGGVPSIYQQGTYSPDANHRWMGSAAMDSAGNMALGFSASSSTLFPSIRYTGRLAGDPPGTMPQGEAVLRAGGGSQTHSASRWGDYSMMAVDPTDDCTFWYTTEYYSVTSSANWRTRIGSFMFPSCTGDPIAIAGDVAINGAPLIGAGVVLKNTQTTMTRNTTTDTNGAYQFHPVDPGTYKITIKKVKVVGTATVSGNLQVQENPSVGNAVKLKDVATGTTLNTTTDISGNYSFGGVPSGRYKIIINNVVP